MTIERLPLITTNEEGNFKKRRELETELKCFRLAVLNKLCDTNSENEIDIKKISISRFTFIQIEINTL